MIFNKEVGALKEAVTGKEIQMAMPKIFICIRLITPMAAKILLFQAVRG